MSMGYSCLLMKNSLDGTHESLLAPSLHTKKQDKFPGSKSCPILHIIQGCNTLRVTKPPRGSRSNHVPAQPPAQKPGESHTQPMCVWRSHLSSSFCAPCSSCKHYFLVGPLSGHSPSFWDHFSPLVHSAWNNMQSCAKTQHSCVPKTPWTMADTRTPHVGSHVCFWQKCNELGRHWAACSLGT